VIATGIVGFDPVMRPVARDQLDPTLGDELDAGSVGSDTLQRLAEALLTRVVPIDIGMIERCDALGQTELNEFANSGLASVPLGQAPLAVNDSRHDGAVFAKNHLRDHGAALQEGHNTAT
jgi:hypothetical protein